MSDSESDDDHPAKSAKKKIEIGPGESQKRQARIVQEKALVEDPTIFQYDEIYDDMTATRQEAKKTKTTEVKKSKYIERLLVTADHRKKEYERRIERQVQRERTAEGDMYKDKETFVTATYRAKLEEMKKAEEAERREEYLENIGDVTKQRDLGGFYRHLYEQKMAAPDAAPLTEDTVKKNSDIDSGPSKMKQRSYRRHNSSADNEDEERKSDEVGTAADKDEPEIKKAHLQSNIDADSDFSIDSDSDSDNGEKSGEKNEMEKSSQRIVDSNTETPHDDTANKATTGASADANGGVVEHVFTRPYAVSALAEPIKPEDTPNVPEKEPTPVPKPKIDIWKKRTVCDVFDAALQRYYERKQLRCQ